MCIYKDGGLDANSKQNSWGGEGAYNWEVDGSVGEKVVVQAGEVRASAGKELQRRLDLDCNGNLALDYIQKLLLFLLNLVAQRVEVLDDLGRTIVRRCSCDIV